MAQVRVADDLTATIVGALVQKTFEQDSAGSAMEEFVENLNERLMRA